MSVPRSADIVVAGIGTAGAVLASRLASASMSVVALEAGPDPGRAGSPAWPADLIDADHVGTSHDWGVQRPGSRPARARVSPGTDHRRLQQPQCTQSVGWRGDRDAWGAVSRGWASSSIERHRTHAMERLHICQPGLAELQPFQRAFFEAAVSAGIPHRDDLLDLDGGTGVAISPVNAAGRSRWNSGFAYLDPVRDRPNLTVCGDALVERIEVTGLHGRGIAVTAVIHGRRSRIVTGKVVLCAGAYGTAEVLLRSGIGPARDLRRLGIPVAADLPGVGANLHDHPTAVRSFAAATPLRSGVEAELAHPCQVVLDPERARQLSRMTPQGAGRPPAHGG